MSDLMIFMCFVLGLSVATVVGLIVVVRDNFKQIKENDCSINWIEQTIDRQTRNLERLESRIRKMEKGETDEL